MTYSEDGRYYGFLEYDHLKYTILSASGTDLRNGTGFLNRWRTRKNSTEDQISRNKPEIQGFKPL